MATEAEVPTGKLTVERFVHTTRDKVFDAWTNPKSMAQWMRPKGVTAVHAEADARVGGKLRLLMHGEDGDCECTGEYRVLEPGQKIELTWTSRDTDNRPTTITALLSEDELEPGCGVHVTHAGFVSPEAVRKHGSAWEAMLDKLAVLERTKKKRRRKMARVSRGK